MTAAARASTTTPPTTPPTMPPMGLEAGAEAGVVVWPAGIIKTDADGVGNLQDR